MVLFLKTTIEIQGWMSRRKGTSSRIIRGSIDLRADIQFTIASIPATAEGKHGQHNRENDRPVHRSFFL